MSALTQHDDKTILAVLKMIDVPKGRMKAVETARKKYKVGTGVPFTWMKNLDLQKRLGYKMKNPSISGTRIQKNVPGKTDVFTEHVKRGIEKMLHLQNTRKEIDNEISRLKKENIKFISSIK